MGMDAPYDRAGLRPLSRAFGTWLEFQPIIYVGDYGLLPCRPPLRGQRRYVPLFKFVPDCC